MHDERSYYRELLKKSRSYRVDLAAKHWCDLHHQHFDWLGKGNEGRAHRVRHLNAHLRALRRASIELRAQSLPHQLFGYVDLADSQNDAVYVHTPNPNGTAFPAELGCSNQECVAPPILACRVDRRLYGIFRATEKGSRVFFLVPRSSEA